MDLISQLLANADNLDKESTTTTIDDLRKQEIPEDVQEEQVIENTEIDLFQLLTANHTEMETQEKSLTMVKEVLNQQKMNQQLIAPSFDESLYFLLCSRKGSGQDVTLAKATGFILQTTTILSNFYELDKGPEHKKLWIDGSANLKHAADIITDLRRELALKAMSYKTFAENSFPTIKCTEPDVCTRLDGEVRINILSQCVQEQINTLINPTKGNLLHTIKSNGYRPTGKQYVYSEGRAGYVLRKNFPKNCI
uniref:Cas9_PI domain-containing protein n=1 Tax=Strongyloides venezuelensis TaxID=75913 RepID=A0A0K0EY18_STRVS